MSPSGEGQVEKDTMESKISRRTLTTGTAWALPVLTVAGTAPALAISTGCSAGAVTVTLGSGTRQVLATGASGMPSKIQWSSTDPTTGVTVTIVTTAIGSTILGRRTGYAVNSYQDTDLTYNGGLNIQHVTSSGAAPGSGGEGQDIAISFSRSGSAVTVSNFSMTIDDIDTKSGNWTDGVTLNTAGVTASVGSNIDGNGGSGTTGNVTSGPWHASESGDGSNDPADRVALSAPSLGSLSLRYFNLPRTQIDGASAGTNSDQNIQLTNMTFQAPAC